MNVAAFSILAPGARPSFTLHNAIEQFITGHFLLDFRTKSLQREKTHTNEEALQEETLHKNALS